MTRTIIVFGIIYVAVIFFVCFFWIIPSVESFRAGQMVVRIRESIYRAEVGLLERHEYNLSEIEFLSEYGIRIFAYDEFISALSEINRLAAGHGLRSLTFVAAEPRFYGQAFEPMLEMRVRAVYEGLFADIKEFVYSLRFAGVTALLIDVGETSRLSIELSLFGGYQ